RFVGVLGSVGRNVAHFRQGRIFVAAETSDPEHRGEDKRGRRTERSRRAQRHGQPGRRDSIHASAGWEELRETSNGNVVVGDIRVVRYALIACHSWFGVAASDQAAAISPWLVAIATTCSPSTRASTVCASVATSNAWTALAIRATEA